MSTVLALFVKLFRHNRHWYAVCPVCATALRTRAAEVKYATEERQP
jgi:hypothetical protein